MQFYWTSATEHLNASFGARYAFEILRFSNLEIDRNFKEVCEQIDVAVRKRL